MNPQLIARVQGILGTVAARESGRQSAEARGLEREVIETVARALNYIAQNRNESAEIAVETAESTAEALKRARSARIAT